MKHIQTNTMTTLLFAALLCIVAEGILFGSDMMIFALIGIGLIYVSMKKQRKLFFWLGLGLLILSVLSMWSLRILLFVTVIYILFKMREDTPATVHVNTSSTEERPLERKKKNNFFQFDDTLNTSYVWEDVHVQNFVGQITIDTTDTILPKGASLISIRQGIGKITVVVPYEIPVRIYYNALMGEATIMQHKYPRLWNESLAVKDGYREHELPERELIIAASSFSGDLEVLRK